MSTDMQKKNDIFCRKKKISFLFSMPVIKAFLQQKKTNVELVFFSILIIVVIKLLRALL